MPCDAEAAEPPPEALWKLLMQTTPPTDLLRTILDKAAARADAGPTVEVIAGGQHAIILQGCTVTIHQHVAPGLQTPPPAAPDLIAV